MVGVVVMMVVKETMIVAETLPSYLPRHTLHSLHFALVVILVYFHLPSWSLTFSTDHARYLDGLS